MQVLKCGSCGSEQPLREMFDAQGQPLCPACSQQFSRSEGGAMPVRRMDPTICARCGADNGDKPYALVLGAPTCPKCMAFYRHRHTPGWVKALMAAVLLLVVASPLWSLRFFRGYFEFWGAGKTQDANLAADLAEAAARHIPEAPAAVEQAAFIKGLVCLGQNRFSEAAENLSRFRNLPATDARRLLFHQAETRAGLERADYEAFLKAAQDFANAADEFARLAPQTVGAQVPAQLRAQAYAQVSLALSCLSVVREDPELRRRAEAKLAEAKKLGGDVLQASHFEDLMRDKRSQAGLFGAYYKKDYERLVQLSEQRAREFPNDPSAQAQVACALACLYAFRGDETLRRRAEAKLEEAMKVNSDLLKKARVEEFIQHRLRTREILTFQEFLKRFPASGSSSGESKP